MRNPTWFVYNTGEMNDILRSAQNQADEVGKVQDIYVEHRLASHYDVQPPFEMIRVSDRWFCFYRTVEPNERRLRAGRNW
jgi:hypothetical protein